MPELNAGRVVSGILFFGTLGLISNCVTVNGGRCHVIVKPNGTSANCSYRNFEDVPQTLPENLTWLDLEGNPIRQITNSSIAKYRQLMYLSLSKCYISKIEPMAFFSTTKIDTLDISNNNLMTESFSENLFLPLAKLKNLFMGYNSIHISQKYPENTLGKLPELEKLYIEGIYNATFRSGFRNLTSLRDLFFQPCRIQIFRNDTFEPFTYSRIEILRLISGVDRIDKGVFLPLTHLKELYIMGNRYIPLTKLLDSLYGLQNRNLTTLDLSSNAQIQGVPSILNSQSAQYLGNMCVKNLNLSSNQICYIHEGFLKKQSFKECYEKIDVSQNVIMGKYTVLYELIELKRLNYFSLSYQMRTSYLTNVRNLQYFKIWNTTLTLPFPDSLRLFNGSFIPKGLIIHDSFIDINITGKSLKTIDLQYSKLLKCTFRLLGPINLKYLNMAGWDCSQIHPNLLSSLVTLKVLIAHNSRLGIGLGKKIGSFLHGLVELKTTDLSSNNLRVMNDDMFHSQIESLEVLILAGNYLDRLYLFNFRKLRILDLRNNRLSTINTSERKYLENLRKNVSDLSLSLAGNPFDCGCNSLDFVEWIFTTEINLDNGGNYTCKNGEKGDTFSVYNNIGKIRKICISNFWLTFSICGVLILVIGIIITGTVYRFRKFIQRWWIIWRRHAREYQPITNDMPIYKYDAFVAYHDTNYQWVCKDLLNFLELRHRMKLCIHHRDFLPGEYITDNILDAINGSRKIVLVISRDFLSSTWANYEIEMSQIRMFQECRNMVIVVFLEDIPRHDMPMSLERLWDNVTCLKMPNKNNHLPSAEACFWESLLDVLKKDTYLL